MKIKKHISYNSRLLIIIISAALSLAPVVFMITNSFMGAGEAAARYTSQIIPENILGTTDGRMHYMDVGFLPYLLSTTAWRQILIEDPSHYRFLVNSIILVVPIVLGQLVIAPLAAYSFERARIKHKDKLYFLYIIIMLLPMQALLVPHFIAANFMGIGDNYMAIILPAIFAPLGVFLIRQQLKGFEKEILEAAAIDGASEFRIFLLVVLPNIKPALIALTVLAFAEAWNIIDQAIVFIRGRYELPMSAYLSVGQFQNIGMVFALSTLFMIPALIIFIYGQDHLNEGIGYSGIK
jgi:multiple sugar transport system permease protein